MLVQSLRDEFDFENPNICPEAPAPASIHLMASGQPLSPEQQTKYRSGVGQIAVFNKMVTTQNSKQCMRIDLIYDSGLSVKLQCNGTSDAAYTEYTQPWSHYATQHKL